jgi:hypothetical protein
MPPLAQDLEQKHLTLQEWRAAFKKRVLERFPIGSSEASMTAELRRQQFHPDNWGSPNGPQRVARFIQYGICEKTITIAWMAEDDRITSIDGYYHFICI